MLAVIIPPHQWPVSAKADRLSYEQVRISRITDRQPSTNATITIEPITSFRARST
jgi:hypothetical protein